MTIDLHITHNLQNPDLNYEEWKIIEHLLQSNTPKKQIARTLNRNVSTIRCEIKRSLPYEEQRMNGFEGDVSMEDLCRKLVHYSSFRRQIDRLQQPTLPGDNRPPRTYREAQALLDRGAPESSAIHDYCVAHRISQAEQSCLESCIQACAVAGITPVQLYNYLTASVKAGEWYGIPPTPASLEQFVRRIEQRNRGLTVLDYRCRKITATEGRLNTALYTPNGGDIQREIVSGGKYRDGLKTRLQSLADDKAAAQEQWKQLTGTAYPNIPYGNGTIPFETQRQKEKAHDSRLI